MQKESNSFLLLVKKGCNPIQLSGVEAADAVVAIDAVGWGRSGHGRATRTLNLVYAFPRFLLDLTLFSAQLLVSCQLHSNFYY